MQTARSNAAVILACAFALATTGCKGAPSQGGGAPDAANATDAVGSPFHTPETIALAPLSGTTKVDEIVAQFEESAKRQPTKPDAWVLLGRAWVRKARESADPGYYLNAEASAQVALGLAPDYSPALDLRTLVLLNDHKFEEARGLAQKIVDAHPEDPVGYGSLGDALLELGRLDEAARAVQRMVDLKPNLASYSRASYIDWLEGRVDDALQVARLAIDAGDSPYDPEPRAWQLVQTAMMFWHKGDYAGADAGFDLAMERGMSDYPPALVGKARCALARGDGKRAAELLDRAYAHSPLVETAWLLGDARAMAGDTDGAARAWAIVEKSGRTADPRTLSLYYSTKNKSPDRALALAEEEKKVRGDVYTEDAYAWALHRNGREADARAAIERALAHGTRDARLMYHAGAIRIASGDAAAGRAMVAAALALNPRFDLTGAREAADLIGAVDGGANLPLRF